MINDRRQLADVYQQTIDIVLEGHYTSENGEEVKLLDNTKMLRGSRFYTKPLDASNIPTLAEGSTKIIVKNDDSIHCGHQLQQEGYNPVILNLASRRNPGGGVKNGSRAQEESLFRSTNLFLSMYRYAEYAEDYGLKKSKFQYPMPVRFGGIYVPYATVFRAGAKDDFALLDTPYYMSFVAVAAINHPDLDRDGNICEEDAALTKNKMRTMLRIGLLNGHDSIVLGAFGCGAFHNPPKHIARLFHEVIDEKEFKDKYKLIAFAILEDHNSPRGGNLQPFIEEFKS
ncbi:TIGR02452 family protein [Segatella copri]|uniref:TIGR02452 family protein n=1 Tax=Segatella copri TaxID=165179 RepID=UPI00258E385C|nr:TIGR02452 family protein [Segatella copri]WOF98569.1 TIGR02452 family protein [Segatella copri]